MFIRSTGLGRTLLRGRIAAIETTNMVPSTLEPPRNGAEEPMRMLMVMEILHPVHWTVRAFVDPDDLRHMVWTVLKNPALIMRGIKFLFTKSPVYPSIEEGTAPGVQPQAPPAMAPTGPKAGPGPIPKPGPRPIPSR
jgi:hypothetical protein